MAEKKEMTLSSWQLAFEMGTFNKPDFNTQVFAGWYDWFCKRESLCSKTKRMGKIIMKIKDGGKIDRDNTYVFFKNNCPLDGPLYDDFRICDIETGDVLFTTRIRCCWNKPHIYTVYGRNRNREWQDDPLYQCSDMRDLADWFNTPWEDK